jgi:surfactin synthase thioesterase subunit/acyl carrier protein
MFAEIGTSMPALRGVVHAAMVIEDQIIMNLDRESFHRALDPKIIGAWLLHRFTLDQPLDFFVLYSSGTTLIGNPGQANYVAGCSYLEGLAHHRQALGLPALAIGWGALGEVGYVARNAKIQTHLARVGMKPIALKQAFESLDSLLSAGVASVTLAHFDWQRMRHAMPALAGAQYAAVVGDADAMVGGAGSGDFRSTLSGLEPAARHEAIVARLKQLLGRVMGLSGSALDHDQPLEQLGVDSLMTVEIGESVESEFGLTVPVMEMADKSIAEIARLLANLLEEESLSSAARESAEPPSPLSPPDIVSTSPPIHDGQWSLVAIPYAAASGTVFSTWSAALGEQVRLLPLELPRTTPGIGQSSPNLADAVEQFGKRILAENDRPFVLYGHSIGALVAFELCRWIRAVGGPTPLHLFVGAFWAPQLLQPHSDALDLWTPGVIDKEVEGLWFKYMAPLSPRAVRENPELLRRTLPALQADLAMLKGYRYRDGEPLECPITCFAGANDMIIPRENVEGWRAQTTREFKVVEVPDGEHLFMRTHRDLIIDVIRDSTLPLLEQDLMEMSVAAD